jgi:hypothetical protein
MSNTGANEVRGGSRSLRRATSPAGNSRPTRAERAVIAGGKARERLRWRNALRGGRPLSPRVNYTTTAQALPGCREGNVLDRPYILVKGTTREP